MAIAVQPFEGTYELDRNHSSFQFAVKHLNLSTFRASFADIDARFAADDGRLVLDGYVRAESISIVEPEFREHVVRGADFFEADAHPLITFRSPNIVLGDDRSATVSGELEIRGVSRPSDGKRDLRAPDRGSLRTVSCRPRAASHGRSPRLGHELAAAPPRRRRRARVGRRDHGAPRAGQEGLMRLLAISGSLRRGSYNAALLDAAAAECPTDVEFVVSGVVLPTSLRTTKTSTPCRRRCRSLRFGPRSSE